MNSKMPNKIREVDSTSWDGGYIVVNKPHTKLIIPDDYWTLSWRSFFFSVYGAITIPSSVKRIERLAFERSVICTELRISAGCKVEEYAFHSILADRLVIGKGVRLSHAAFHQCTFNEIVFEDENDIIDGAFEECWCSHSVPKNPMEQKSYCCFPDWILEKYPQLSQLS